MLPVSEPRTKKGVPIVTWTIIGLNVLLFLWDREFRVFGQPIAFSELAMTPHSVTGIFRGAYDPFAMVTLFTSIWLHGNLMHLLGNMLYLTVFGGSIELTLGSWRYVLYYLFWGLAASAAHIAMDPDSRIMVLGASGAIGGVLGAYFLLYPANKIEISILAFIDFEIAAWVLLGGWFIWQIAVPQEGVANWAHAGGFLAGMITVLVMGGREVVLKRTEGIDYDF